LTNTEAIEQLKKVKDNKLILDENILLAVRIGIIALGKLDECINALETMHDFRNKLIKILNDTKEYWGKQPCTCEFVDTGYEMEETKCERCFELKQINQILQEVTK
jgi:hypothetical protein